MGEWKPIITQIWDTVVRPCDCCGKVVPRREWVAEVDGDQHHFCSERCENLYRSYVVPRQQSRPLA